LIINSLLRLEADAILRRLFVVRLGEIMTTQKRPASISFIVLIALCFFGFASPVSKVALAEVTFDGSLGAAGPALPDGSSTYLIPEANGARAGANLFHSFGEFNIDAGEIATFTGAADINSIIARVTGGASSIDGTIRSTIDGANLYLLNPRGVMFGPDASLDVSGSFHVSTADYLRFDNGETFYATPAANSILSVAAPESFGFLTSSPAGISGNNSLLQVPEGNVLSIIGGDITLTGTPVTPDDILYMPGVLTAPAGSINLVSVASPGEVNFAAGDMGIASFSQLGNITLSDGAKLSVVGNDSTTQGAGSIVIRGGQLLFKDGGMDVYGNPGGMVDIKGGSLHLDNYYIFAATYGETNHPGTACGIELTNDLLMTHAALIDTQVGPVDPYVSGISGDGGDISITAANIKLGDDQIDAGSFTSIGFYGYIASASDGSGKSGNIDITTGNAVIQNGFSVSTQTFAEGDTGDIVLHATGTLRILDAANIGVLAFWSGKGGDIDISAPDIFISAANRSAVTDIYAETGIYAQTDYYSDGGTIKVTADNLQVLDGGRINTVLYGSGHGADVEINARNTAVDGFVADNDTYYLSSIDGRVFGAYATGLGGNIDVTTDTLSLTNGGAMRTGLDDSAPGQAGNITINAGAIDIASRGRIYADSLLGAGNSGDIAIDAQTLTITGARNVPLPEPFKFDFTGLSTSTQDGRGGNINVNLTGDLSVSEEGAISADSQGPGEGGGITIAARNATLIDEGKISSAGYGTGDAGNCSVATKDTLLMRGSAITTEAMHADGGDIFITSPYMVRLDGSRITASVGGGPETTGGNIRIDPRFVILKNSQIIANAYEGRGGNIQIVADTFLSDPQSIVDASSQLGISGMVDIQANITNVTGLVSSLSTDFVSATDLLRERCIARIREGGKYSSFVVGGRDGLPIEPGNLLQGLMY
jgi:filamentous hemagglutinin family protein